MATTICCHITYHRVKSLSMCDIILSDKKIYCFELRQIAIGLHRSQIKSLCKLIDEYYQIFRLVSC